MRKKLLALILAVTFCVSMLPSVTYAGTWSQYSRTKLTNNAYRGLKGDFKLPSIDAQYTSTYEYNFITFEEWLTVNAAPDWFEIGYMDGALDPENDGTTEDYKGFYKAKSIDGNYWEAKLVKTATVGTRYTFTIVDVDAQNLWEIYIGSTYFGSFADSVDPYNGDFNYQGYEVSVEPGSATPILNSTDITNQMFYSSTSGTYSWKNWSTGTVVTHNNNSWGLTASWSSADNKTTITKN